MKTAIKYALFASSLEVWKTPIDAKHNWWGFNESLAVSGRIKDRADEPDLLEVEYKPFLQSNKTILDGKCPPGWKLFKDTCYIYIGAPMSFHDARTFCQVSNKPCQLLYQLINAFKSKL